MVMIAGEAGIHRRDQTREVGGLIRSPAQAFFAQRAVETFTIGLFVRFVGTGHAMPLAIGARLLRTCPFELWATISLQHRDPPRTPPRHGGSEKGRPIVAGQSGPPHDLRRLGVHIDSREGEQVAKRHGIHLDDRSGADRRRNRASLLVLPPLGADHVFLCQNLIDLRHREPDMLLPLQEIRDRLPTAVMLANPQLPHEPLDRGRDLACPAGAGRGLRIALKVAREAISRHALYPQPDGLPMSPQMCRNLRVTESLLGQLKREGQLCECVHVHRLLWTVGYLRQHCGNGLSYNEWDHVRRKRLRSHID